MKLVQLSVFALVALALGLGVLKPILTVPPVREIEALASPSEILEDGEDPPVNEAGQIELNPEVLALAERRMESVEDLKTVITDRAEESSSILQKWLDTPQPQPQQEQA